MKFLCVIKWAQKSRILVSRNLSEESLSDLPGTKAKTESIFFVKNHIIAMIQLQDPANIYLFKLNSRRTSKKRDIYSKITMKTSRTTSLFLTWSIFHTFFSCFIVYFEQMNVCRRFTKNKHNHRDFIENLLIDCGHLHVLLNWYCAVSCSFRCNSAYLRKTEHRHKTF